MGLGRNPAPQRAGAGSRPRQMALKWSKMGYIPFIASQNCLKRNLGRGRTQGSCPLFRSTSSALAQPFDAPTAPTAGRGMRPIARTNARTHTSTIRGEMHRFAVEPTPDRTAWRCRGRCPCYLRYAVTVRSGCCLVLGRLLTAINAELARFALSGRVMGVCGFAAQFLAMPQIPAGRDRTVASRA